MVITQQLIGKFSTSEQSNCMRGFYTEYDNWYSYSSEIFAPTSCIHTVGNQSYIEFDKTDTATERNLFILVTTIGILLILMTINFRSLNFYRMDWFRLILVYIIGTLGVIVVVQGGASTPGFNRLLGFGILVHNFAEGYLLKNMWFGHQGLKSFFGVGGAVLYLWVMSTFIWLLPINVFFFVAMWQGASFDYLLVYTTPYVASLWKTRPWNRISWILAAVAAVIHITSIQPLFFGMSLAFAPISAITTVFLFPTFFFYTFWAIRELGRVAFVGPSYQDTVNGRIVKGDGEILTELIKIEKDLSPNSNSGNKAEVLVQDTEEIAKQREADKKSQELEILKDIKSDDIRASGELARIGLLRYFKLPTRVFVFTLIGAMLTSFANCCVVFWAPCFIHIDCHSK